MAVRVLVADDDELVRLALGALLGDDPDLEVVALVADAAEAVVRAAALRPDIAVVDVRMPGGGGLVATRGIRAASPATRVVVCSAYDDPALRADMCAAGAERYVAKGSGLLSLPAVVREVAGLDPAPLPAPSR